MLDVAQFGLWRLPQMSIENEKAGLPIKCSLHAPVVSFQELAKYVRSQGDIEIPEKLTLAAILSFAWVKLTNCEIEDR